MPPRRKRKLIDIKSALGLKTTNLQVDPLLAQTDWTPLIAARASALPNRYRPLPIFVKPAAFPDIAALREKIKQTKHFAEFYQSLPAKIDKHLLINVLAARLDEPDFRIWSRRYKRHAGRSIKEKQDRATVTTNTDTAARL